MLIEKRIRENSCPNDVIVGENHNNQLQHQYAVRLCKCPHNGLRINEITSISTVFFHNVFSRQPRVDVKNREGRLLGEGYIRDKLN